MWTDFFLGAQWLEYLLLAGGLIDLTPCPGFTFRWCGNVCDMVTLGENCRLNIRACSDSPYWVFETMLSPANGGTHWQLQKLVDVQQRLAFLCD